MIQSLLTTIIPMLAASLIMMGGGLRLAKTTENEITPHNRELLLEFSHAFRSELTHLETLHQGHLEALSKLTREEERLTLRSSAQNIEGIESIFIFQNFGVFDESKDPESTKIKITKNSQAPLVSLSTSREKKPPTNSLVQLPANIFDEENLPWISTPSRRYQVHFFNPEPDIVIAIVVNELTTHRITFQALAKALERPSLPLIESDERVLVGSTRTEKPLFLSGSAQHGPAAAFIPFRSALGDFEILAWDGITTKTSYNQTILATAIALALLLNLIGFFLFFHHRRTTKLAAQRVSFVNQVSHELGTPLTNLNLNLDLAEEFVSTHPTEAKKRLDLVKDELARLSRLVANVLTFSSKERDKLKIETEPCSPTKIIEATIDRFRLTLERSQVEILTKLPATPEILISPDALSQIMTNLISNVEKYALEGKQLVVTMAHENERLSVTVSDQGPGITKSQREQIFEPFKRLSQDTTEGVSGVGLGLAISRELAIKMGGSLKLQASAKGATFKLTIPAPLAS